MANYVIKLQGAMKNYEWGKPGLRSVVASLQNSAFGTHIDENTPYAEMWIGTHSSGPATIPSLNNKKLLDWLLSNPKSLGDNITNSYEKSKGLPFLFKVLSVNKSLSIQAHPDKEMAKKLHSEFPDRYPDDNHKPEMAIALTDFEALCGFRPISEIQTFFKEIPQLKEIVGSDICDRFLNSTDEKELKPVFTAVMTCSPNVFQPLLQQISESFKVNQFKGKLFESISDLFLRILDQYPNDIGCFCLFFLNYLKLKCGEAIFLAANEPHAYLYGDCIECMACSDNVIRAGLTPKFRDVETLCKILTYNCKSSEQNMFVPVNDSQDPFVKIYSPPVNEFAVDSITLTANGEVSYILRIIQSASILLVIKGCGTYNCNDEQGPLMPGSILYISSGCQVTLTCSTQFLSFRAYCKA